jgi:hypothetical protein
MGIFSRESRAEKHQRELEQLFANLDSAKQEFSQRLGLLSTSPYLDVSSMPIRTRPTPGHIKMDKSARKEVMLFINDFLGKSWSEVTELHNQTPEKWRTWILNPLILALRKYIPMATDGTERKIATLFSQGVDLSVETKAYYIQRDICTLIDGVGSADFVRENNEVYKHAEFLLLKQIIETLIVSYPSKDKTWLNDASWYYATLFCEYMQWSYLEGPFKQSRRAI